MIRLPEVTISPAVSARLKRYQDEIDALTAFAEKSARAKTSFKSKNTNRNKTFNAVKKALTEMCSGARRCVYCEDSVADEVEHIRPKDFFPENCFVWENYVYACGSCNGPKNNKFAILSLKSDGSFYPVNSNAGAPPPSGKDVMINPRRENPLEFCVLDFKEFKFIPLPTLDATDRQRAEYTFNTLLNLNDAPREFLRKARENAYGNYKMRLSYYSGNKANLSPAIKDKIIEQLKQEAHPTVWKEMKRYYREKWLKAIDEELHNLFEESPEALDW